jgi:hypothetical protein
VKYGIAGANLKLHEQIAVCETLDVVKLTRHAGFLRIINYLLQYSYECIVILWLLPCMDRCAENAIISAAQREGEREREVGLAITVAPWPIWSVEALHAL